jgi:hypothetical protein
MKFNETILKKYIINIVFIFSNREIKKIKRRRRARRETVLLFFILFYDI